LGGERERKLTSGDPRRDEVRGGMDGWLEDNRFEEVDDRFILGGEEEGGEVVTED